jgi:hypothetical protein
MKKRWEKWNYVSCDDHETQEHLFFLCPLAKYFCSVVSVSLAIDTLPEYFTYLYAHTRRDRKAIIIGFLAVL